MRKSIFILLSLLALSSSANATAFSGISPLSRGGAADIVAGSPVNIKPPEIVGLDTVGSTLAFNPGIWTGGGITLTHTWHYPSGASRGTGATYGPLLSGEIGQPIVITETATNSSGSLSVNSYWVGPVEASLPSAPVPNFETCLAGHSYTSGNVCGVDPTILPKPPVHVLQNAHAIYPGCEIPPATPTFTSAVGGAGTHTWYFDPVNGSTQAAGGLGTKARPFKDINALFATQANYSSSPLFGVGRTIIPGDTIYNEPGANAESFVVPAGTYSTLDGTSTGTPEWTWVMTDPAVSSRAQMAAITFATGSNFLFKHLGVDGSIPQQYYLGAVIISNTGASTTTAPTAHDIVFEDVTTGSQVGHSDDPWSAGYPLDHGSSDGTVVTAAAAVTNNYPGGENPLTITATMANGASSLVGTLIDTRIIPGNYVWSPGYYTTGVSPTFSTTTHGMPNGTIIHDISGLGEGHYVNVGAVNGIVPSNLTAATPNNGTVASTGSMTGTTGYWILATSTTAVQSVYTWTGSAWASVGTIPPQTTATADSVRFATVNNHVAHWNGTSWDDLGVISVNFAACDATNDAATGCPAANYSTGIHIPQCDPAIYVAGAVVLGGCSGTVTAWSGTTNALSSATLPVTDRLVMIPAGGFTQSDWALSVQDGFSIRGGVDTTDSLEVSFANYVVGISCISIKDSWARSVMNGFGISRTTNSVLYNDRVKFFGQDAYDIYSDNRVLVIHSYASDPIIPWNHEDLVQVGIDGTPTGAFFFNNAIVDSEFQEGTDLTNLLSYAQAQGLDNTDGWQWGAYWANNISLSPLNNALAGKYSVAVNNTIPMFSLTVANNTHDGSTNGWPLGNLIANNVSNGLNRSAIAGVCDPSTGDLDTVATNIAIPFRNSPTSFANSTFCTLPTNSNSPAGAGVFIGLMEWSGVQWDSTGSAPLFKDFALAANPTSPSPGWQTATGNPSIFPYVNLSILPFGNALGGAGTVNTRLNSSFIGTPMTLTGNVKAGGCCGVPFLQSGRADGEFWMVQGFGGGGAPGVWETCGGAGGTLTITVTCASLQTSGQTKFTTTNQNSGGQITTAGSEYVQISTTYTPPLAGMGTPLGAQMPITDHDSNGWNSTHPAVGAYEGGTSVPLDHPFTPLHLFYMAPTTATPPGNDANNGTSPSTPWASAKHNGVLVCGDVIIAKAGFYNSALFDTNSAGVQLWGTVSGCPSNTGGIDGGGGIYFAVLHCETFDACKINASTAYAMTVSNSNWLVDGFEATNTNNGTGTCFIAQPSSVGNISFDAFINVVAIHCPLTGVSLGAYPNQANSGDEFAAVGVVSYDGSASAAECGSAFGLLAPINVTAMAGTHIYFDQLFASQPINGPCSSSSIGVGAYPSVSGSPTTGSPNLTVSAVSGWGVDWPIGAGLGQNYAASSPAIPQPTFVSAVAGLNVTLSNNIVAPGLTNTQLLAVGTSTDGECWIADTMGGSPYTGQVVVRNMAGWGCGGHGIIQFCNPSCNAGLTIDYANITVYGAGHDYKRDGNVWGFYDNNQNTNLHYSLNNSIFQMDVTKPLNSLTRAAWNGTTGVGKFGTGQIVTAAGFGGSTAVSVTGNYFFSAPGASCGGGVCDAGNNISQFFGTGFATGNNLVNPNLASPGSLLTTAPNCTGFANVVDCMNNGPQGVAGHIASSAAPTAGYQPPGPCVASDPLYPIWLKGVVNLHWDGSNLVELSGLVTKPCNM